MKRNLPEDRYSTPPKRKSHDESEPSASTSLPPNLAQSDHSYSSTSQTLGETYVTAQQPQPRHLDHSYSAPVTHQDPPSVSPITQIIDHTYSTTHSSLPTERNSSPTVSPQTICVDLRPSDQSSTLSIIRPPVRNAIFRFPSSPSSSTTPRTFIFPLFPALPFGWTSRPLQLRTSTNRPLPPVIHRRTSPLPQQNSLHVGSGSLPLTSNTTSQEHLSRAHTAPQNENPTLRFPAFSYNPSATYDLGNIGSMSQACTHCNAMKWNDEPPGMCCANGKVNVPLLGPPPEPLSSLLTGADTASKNFRSMIRLYNSSFQMTSFGTATEGRIIREPGWNPTFKVQGQIYHRIGPLRPPADETAAFLQIYFMQDPEEEADRRLAWQGRTHLDRSLILTLQAMLHSENAYITEFKTQLDRQTEIAAHYRIVIRADRIPVGHHPRTFNTPQCNEVAALVLNSEEAQYRDVVLTSRNNALQRVNEVHVAYDAWQYPLLFPRGEDGYHLEQRLIDPLTKQRTDKKMSVLQFYAFRLMLRPNDFNILLRAGKLSHQFFVDMYVKIETERLSFYRKNQKKLRAENYCHLRDAIETDDNVRNLGQLVILPSSFTGGPRYMHEKSQDAMTYVKNFGPPELFITITCNPKWPEITNELLPLQTAVDRPDIIARVFT